PLMILSEITVTDMMQVRTFAEEVYTQLVAGDKPALARAVAVSLPVVLLVAGLVLWTSFRWERTLPARESLAAPTLVISLGRGGWLWLLAILLFIVLCAGIPLASLIWKTGLSGSPETWSGHVAYTWLQKNVRDRGSVILQSLLVGVVSGGLAAGLAVMLCWLATASRWFQVLALALMATVWALPGPIPGLGMQQAILIILDVLPFHALSVALYDGPSPLPVAWVNVVRFFPCAVAVLWPVVRLLPADLRDAA